MPYIYGLIVIVLIGIKAILRATDRVHEFAKQLTQQCQHFLFVEFGVSVVIVMFVLAQDWPALVLKSINADLLRQVLFLPALFDADNLNQVCLGNQDVELLESSYQQQADQGRLEKKTGLRLPRTRVD